MIAQAFRHLVLDNPMTMEGTRVWRRFLRTGSDTGRAVNATIFALLGVLYLWLLYATVHFREDLSGPILLVELVVLTLVVPASLFSAISGEREKLTWDALILTRLTPAQIIVGKLLWRLCIIGITLLLFLPPMLIGHWHNMNGPDYTDSALGLSLWILFTWGLLLAGFSLWVSTKTKRSVTTLSLIAAGLLAFLGLVPLLSSLFTQPYQDTYHFTGSPGHDLTFLLYHLHPFTLLLNDLLRSNGRFVDPSGISARLALAAQTPWIYAGGGLFFVISAWRQLRGLEIARRRL